MRYLLLLFMMVLSSAFIYAQDLKVVEFYKDNSTINIGVQKKDLNGRICALVKVQLPIAGVKFEGSVVESKFDINEYLVYMSSGSKKLAIKCPYTKPLSIDFCDISQINSVESKGVYVLSLEVTNNTSSTEDLESVRLEYCDIVERANDCIAKKDYSTARKYYEKAINPKFSKFYNIESFGWIDLCDTIIKAQAEFKAMTPQLANAFMGLSEGVELAGFSEGIMVIDHGSGNISLISKDGNKVKLQEAFVFHQLFSENLLPIYLNGAYCYINKDGSIALNYRNTENDLFKDSNLFFQPFSDGYAKIFNDGKVGLINKYGKTILSPYGKYRNLVVLEDRIQLFDKKHIYIAPIGLRNLLLTKKDIFESLDYSGYIFDMTKDYILIHNNYKSDHGLTYEINVIASRQNRIFKKNGVSYCSKVNDGKIVVVDDTGLILIDLKTWSEKLISTDKRRMVISENTIFNGKDCFDFDGNLIFSLDEYVDFSNVGFSDGYMLVEANGKYRYIDKMGNTLLGSEFKMTHAKSKFLMLYGKKPFGDGFGLIIRNGQWGLIDRFGITSFDLAQP